MTPPLTDHQADQLARLKATLVAYPAMQGGFAVIYQQGCRESDVPEVYRELAELGLVTITISDGGVARIYLVRDDEAA